MILFLTSVLVLKRIKRKKQTSDGVRFFYAEPVLPTKVALLPNIKTALMISRSVYYIQRLRYAVHETPMHDVRRLDTALSARVATVRHGQQHHRKTRVSRYKRTSSSKPNQLVQISPSSTAQKLGNLFSLVITARKMCPFTTRASFV